MESRGLSRGTLFWMERKCPALTGNEFPELPTNVMFQDTVFLSAIIRSVDGEHRLRRVADDSCHGRVNRATNYSTD